MGGLSSPSQRASVERDLLSGFGGLAPGRRLDRYELLAPVGRGGMAVVWAARLLGSRGFAKAVAVKTMLPALSADARFEKMFLTEASVASAVRHPNVCEVLDLGESDGLLYLVMEWVEGATLAALLEACAGRIPAGVAARVALDVARGLAAAHASTGADGQSLGVVHRDVSPQNILVGLDGRSKIADFGVVKLEGGAPTQPGFVKGKVRYMAPEQVYCEEVDARTDVFALGVVLYEATTGVHPFARATDLATLAAIASAEEPRPPTSVDPGYPIALEAVVLRALAKEPSDRWASMAALEAALEAALGDEAAPEDVAGLVSEACASSIAERRSAIEAAARASEPIASRRDEAPGAPARSPVDRRALMAIAAAVIVLLAVTGLRPSGSKAGGPGTPPGGASAASSPPRDLALLEPPAAAPIDPAVEPVRSRSIGSATPEPATAPSADRGSSPATLRPRRREGAPALASPSAAPRASAPPPSRGILETRE